MVDIYEDLEHFDFSEEVDKLRVENRTLSDRILALEADKKCLSEKLTTLEKQAKELRTNISSLHKTSIGEVQRKDRIIQELRQEVDNLTYRRNNHSHNKQWNVSENETTIGHGTQETVPREDRHSGDLTLHKHDTSSSKIKHSQSIGQENKHSTDNSTKRDLHATETIKRKLLDSSQNPNPPNKELVLNSAQQIGKHVTSTFGHISSLDHSVSDRIEERRIKLTQMEFEKDYFEAMQPQEPEKKPALSASSRNCPSSNNKRSSREKSGETKKPFDSPIRSRSRDNSHHRICSKRSRSPHQATHHKGKRSRTRSRDRKIMKRPDKYEESHSSRQYRPNDHKYFSRKLDRLSLERNLLNSRHRGSEDSRSELHCRDAKSDRSDRSDRSRRNHESRKRTSSPYFVDNSKSGYNKQKTENRNTVDYLTVRNKKNFVENKHKTQIITKCHAIEDEDLEEGEIILDEYLSEMDNSDSQSMDQEENISVYAKCDVDKNEIKSTSKKILNVHNNDKTHNIPNVNKNDKTDDNILKGNHRNAHDSSHSMLPNANKDLRDLLNKKNKILSVKDDNTKTTKSSCKDKSFHSCSNDNSDIKDTLSTEAAQLSEKNKSSRDLTLQADSQSGTQVCSTPASSQKIVRKNYRKIHYSFSGNDGAHKINDNVGKEMSSNTEKGKEKETISTENLNFTDVVKNISYSSHDESETPQCNVILGATSKESHTQIIDSHHDKIPQNSAETHKKTKKLHSPVKPHNNILKSPNQEKLIAKVKGKKSSIDINELFNEDISSYSKNIEFELFDTTRNKKSPHSVQIDSKLNFLESPAKEMSFSLNQSSTKSSADKHTVELTKKDTLCPSMKIDNQDLSESVKKDKHDTSKKEKTLHSSKVGNVSPKKDKYSHTSTEHSTNTSIEISQKEEVHHSSENHNKYVSIESSKKEKNLHTAKEDKPKSTDKSKHDKLFDLPITVDKHTSTEFKKEKQFHPHVISDKHTTESLKEKVIHTSTKGESSIAKSVNEEKSSHHLSRHKNAVLESTKFEELHAKEDKPDAIKSSTDILHLSKQKHKNKNESIDCASSKLSEKNGKCNDKEITISNSIDSKKSTSTLAINNFEKSKLNDNINKPKDDLKVKGQSETPDTVDKHIVDKNQTISSSPSKLPTSINGADGPNNSNAIHLKIFRRKTIIKK